LTLYHGIGFIFTVQGWIGVIFRGED